MGFDRDSDETRLREAYDMIYTHVVFLFIFLQFNSVLLGIETSYSHVDSDGIFFDQKLLEIFKYKKNGFFIEAGAHDGVCQSNTKRLEEFHHWTGILVEPSKCLFEKLCAARQNSLCFQCALGSHDQNNTYVYGDFNGNPMSSVGGTRTNNTPHHRVLVRSLQSIVDEIGIHHIDFLSLDTEGYELKIIHGIDFETTTFDYILIEIYNDQYNEIISFLSNKGYELIENFSNYNYQSNPYWDGTQNDFLFKRKSIIDILNGV